MLSVESDKFKRILKDIMLSEEHSSDLSEIGTILEDSRREKRLMEEYKGYGNSMLARISVNESFLIEMFPFLNS